MLVMLMLMLAYFCCYFIDGHRVFLVDPELIKYVAANSHKFNRPVSVKQNIPSFGNGLLASNGKAHARQKRMIGPVFTSKYLKGFLGVYKENVDNLVKVNSMNSIL